MSPSEHNLPDILRPTELHDFGTLFGTPGAGKRFVRSLLAAIAIALLGVGGGQLQASNPAPQPAATIAAR